MTKGDWAMNMREFMMRTSPPRNASVMDAVYALRLQVIKYGARALAMHEMREKGRIEKGGIAAAAQVGSSAALHAEHNTICVAGWL